MKSRRITYFLATVVTGIMMFPFAHSQQPITSTTKPANADKDQVYSIVLPQYPPEIPNGPHVDSFIQNCLVCHTARYVLMQPSFSRTVWQNEVKKMVDAYGATISEAEQASVVEYLVAVKGIKPSSSPAVSK